MGQNLARQRLIDEELIYAISQDPIYHKGNIEKEFEKFIALKDKIDNVELYTKEIKDKIRFYETEINRRVYLFEEGKNINEVKNVTDEGNVKKDVKPVSGVPGMPVANALNGMQGMQGMQGFYDSSMPGTGMGMPPTSGYLFGGGSGKKAFKNKKGGMGLYGMNAFAGNYGYDNYGNYGNGYGSGYGNGYGTGVGPVTQNAVLQNMKAYAKAALTKDDYGSEQKTYAKNKAEIDEIRQKIIDEQERKGQETDDKKRKQIDETIISFESDIKKLNEENDEIIKKFKEGLEETSMIHELQEELKKIIVTPEDKVEFEKLKTFFEDVLEYDTSKLTKCDKDGSRECFEEAYHDAKGFINKERVKYNIIISLYKQLTETPGYDYGSPEFIQNMLRIKRAMLAQQDMLFGDGVISDKIIKDDLQDSTSEFKKPLKELTEEQIKNIVPEKFAMVKKPEKLFMDMTPAQFGAMTPQQLMWLPQGGPSWPYLVSSPNFRNGYFGRRGDPDYFNRIKTVPAAFHEKLDPEDIREAFKHVVNSESPTIPLVGPAALAKVPIDMEMIRNANLLMNFLKETPVPLITAEVIMNILKQQYKVEELQQIMELLKEHVTEDLLKDVKFDKTIKDNVEKFTLVLDEKTGFIVPKEVSVLFNNLLHFSDQTIKNLTREQLIAVIMAIHRGEEKAKAKVEKPTEAPQKPGQKPQPVPVVLLDSKKTLDINDETSKTYLIEFLGKLITFNRLGDLTDDVLLKLHELKLHDKLEKIAFYKNLSDTQIKSLSRSVAKSKFSDESKQQILEKLLGSVPEERKHYISFKLMKSDEQKIKDYITKHNIKTKISSSTDPRVLIHLSKFIKYFDDNKEKYYLIIHEKLKQEDDVYKAKFLSIVFADDKFINSVTSENFIQYMLNESNRLKGLIQSKTKKHQLWEQKMQELKKNKSRLSSASHKAVPVSHQQVENPRVSSRVPQVPQKPVSSEVKQQSIPVVKGKSISDSIISEQSTVPASSVISDKISQVKITGNVAPAAGGSMQGGAPVAQPAKEEQPKPTADAKDKLLISKAKDDPEYEGFIYKLETWEDTYNKLAKNCKNVNDAVIKYVNSYNYVLNSLRAAIASSDIQDMVDDKDDNDDFEKFGKKIREMMSAIQSFDTSSNTSSNNSKVLTDTVNKNDEFLQYLRNTANIGKVLQDKEKVNLIDNLKKYNRELDKNKDEIESAVAAVKKDKLKTILENLNTSSSSIMQELKNIMDQKRPKLDRYGMMIGDTNVSRYKRRIEDKINTVTLIINQLSDIASTELGEIKSKLQSISDTILSNIGAIIGKLKKRNKTAAQKVAENKEYGDELVTDSIYKRVWDKYLEDLSDTDKLVEESQDKLYKQYQGNNLDPDIELKVTRDDKILFLVIAFIFRQIVLSIIDTLIDKDLITRLYVALIAYVGIYVGFIILAVIIINLDDYKLRILFNYFNMHVNSSGIMLHVFMLVVFTFIMYSLIYNMNNNLDNNTATVLSEAEKLRLIYKAELMTLAIFVFTASSDILLI